MGKLLTKGMQDFETREGMQGRYKMAIAAGVSERMIRRYASGQSMPTSDQAYEIAKSWGVSDEKALAVARECTSSGARKAG